MLFEDDAECNPCLFDPPTSQDLQACGIVMPARGIGGELAAPVLPACGITEKLAAPVLLACDVSSRDESIDDDGFEERRCARYAISTTKCKIMWTVEGGGEANTERIGLGIRLRIGGNFTTWIVHFRLRILQSNLTFEALLMFSANS